LIAFWTRAARQGGERPKGEEARHPSAAPFSRKCGYAKLSTNGGFLIGNEARAGELAGGEGLDTAGRRQRLPE
jgi:hypothetical protein